MIAGAVRSAFFQHDELVGWVGANETLSPVPVIRANAFFAQVGVVVCSVWTSRYGQGIGVGWAAFLGWFAGFLRQVVECIDEVIHLVQEIASQRGVVVCTGIGLCDG